MLWHITRIPMCKAAVKQNAFVSKTSHLTQWHHYASPNGQFIQVLNKTFDWTILI
jgi:hypothetical protein